MNYLYKCINCVTCSYKQNKHMRQGSSSVPNLNAVVMYVDMNSYFASCEQQDRPELRDRPMGILTYDSPNATIIAPSKEAKRFGVKTGMRLNEGKELCPHMIGVMGRPYRYRAYHVKIMEVLNSYCDDVIARSIDEASMNLTSYRLVYTDMVALAKQVKEDIRLACGDYVTCSIGIAPNSFLAKLGTELQKPNGLVRITPENIDEQLSKLKLTDLPGIASKNERRLKLVGINTPLQLRHTSEEMLRKAFGGVVGNYWYKRLHFMEIDIYTSGYKNMSAGRTVSRSQRESKQALESLLVALCTRLEQRMVKQEVFCRTINFAIRYRDYTRWDATIKLAHPSQDATEIRKYIEQQIQEYEQLRTMTMLNSNTKHICVTIGNFVSDKMVQYTLFDNKIKHDWLRKAMYNIKDKYGRDVVRKASETIQPKVMRDAIGFGSVKDLYDPSKKDSAVNQYLLEEE